MVSYEVFFAARGRATRAGAQLLIVPTNTSSYATSQVPTQEIAASEIQAMPQGRDLLQASPTGYSAAITNRGAPRALGRSGPARSSPPPCPGGTGGRSTSDSATSWPSALAGLALLAGWVVAGRGRRTRAGGGRAEPGGVQPAYS